MIARAPYLFLLLILIPDLYLDLRYWRNQLSTSKRILRWLPSFFMVGYTLKLAFEPNFIPDDPNVIYIYLLLLGLLVVPKAVYMLCSMTGLGFSLLLHKKNVSPTPDSLQTKSRRNYGNLIGLMSVPVIWYIVLYGSFIGFQKMEVNRQTYASKDLPKAFDNYKIALFSDAHVGSYTEGNQWILQRMVDSINTQKPDMIVFTGDLLNTQPQDLYRHMDILSRLKAKDGVFSILGNHDYAEYIAGDDIKKRANCKETISLERQLGWTLLLNENREIKRGESRIILAGMENDGDGKHFPQKGNVQQALSNVKEGDFILMLEHDPSAWRRKIIPDGRSQLTLSGHTHSMQFSIFGWCPMSVTGKEYCGWYNEGSQSLFVTAGLGGLIPFRFGATGEIVIITLHTAR